MENGDGGTYTPGNLEQGLSIYHTCLEDYALIKNSSIEIQII